MSRERVKERGLNFTGNWFIDAGILGFVNLMEEVYGWDLEELQKRISEDEEKIYYGLFPLAYFMKWLEDKKYSIKKNPDISKLLKELNSCSKHKDILDKIWWKNILPLYEEKWSVKKIEEIINKKAHQRANFSQTSEDFTKKVKDLLVNHESEIRKILKKKKKINKITLEDIKKLFESTIENKQLKDAIDKLKQSYNKLLEELREMWGNVITKREKYVNEQNQKFFRLPVDSGFYKNFVFFNNSEGLLKQKDQLFGLINFDIEKNEALKKIDKMVNKLLPSSNEFSNVNYMQFQTKNLSHIKRLLYIYFLSHMLLIDSKIKKSCFTQTL